MVCESEVSSKQLSMIGACFNYCPRLLLGFEFAEGCAHITDEDGRLTVGRVQVPASFARDAAEVPLTREVIHDGAHILDGVEPLPERGRPAAEFEDAPAVLRVVPPVDVEGLESAQVASGGSAQLKGATRALRGTLARIEESSR